MAPPPPVQRSATARFLMGLAVVTACLSLIAITVGVYFVLLQTYTLPQTMLMMGTGGLVFSIVAGGVAWGIYNARMLKNKIRNKVVHHKVNTLLEAVKEEITAPIREYPKTSAALAALAGLVIAEKYGKKSSDMLNDFLDGDIGREVQHRLRQLMH